MAEIIKFICYITIFLFIFVIVTDGG